MSIEMQKFQGGGGARARAAIVAVVGLVVGIAGLFVDHKAALFGYLVAFAYWAGIAFTSLIALMIFHCFRAKWMTVLRRPLEAMATTVPWFLLLAIPILVWMKDVYSWVEPQANGYNAHEIGILQHKAAYLNTTGFIIRTVVYFVIGGLLAWRFFRLSTQQDTSGDPALTQKARNLSLGGLPFLALLFTFASFDWLMSLNPLWFSTIFGVYYFAGAYWSVMAILIIVCTRARGKDLFGDFVNPEHMQNLGKLLLAFTAFWAYIAFSQLMLIWIANLPEEVPFFIVRFKGPWAWAGIALILFHFVVPFFTLLSRDIKRRPARLSLVAGGVLLVNLLDVYWLVMPTYDPEHLPFNIWMVFAWIGMGGFFAFFALSKIRGHYTMPVKDPFLDVSLRYRQPT